MYQFLNSIMQVRINCLDLSEQTSGLPALLNATCLLKCVTNCEQNFSFAICRSGLSDTQINCNLISYRLLYL
jgi:hypothetical protein